MGLFSSHAARTVDLRDREYVLTGCPLVAHDDQVVLVDATVRLTVRQPTDDEDLVLGYSPAEELAMHAACVLGLRLLAAGTPSDELTVGHARVTEALEQALSFAPVGTGVRARVLSVEVRPHDPDLASLRHEFRIVGA